MSNRSLKTTLVVGLIFVLFFSIFSNVSKPNVSQDSLGQPESEQSQPPNGPSFSPPQKPNEVGPSINAKTQELAQYQAQELQRKQLEAEVRKFECLVTVNTVSTDSASIFLIKIDAEKKATEAWVQFFWKDGERFGRVELSDGNGEIRVPIPNAARVGPRKAFVYSLPNTRDENLMCESQ